MKNAPILHRQVPLFLLIAFSSLKLFAQPTDTLSFVAPIIIDAFGITPQGIQVKFIDTNTNEFSYFVAYATNREGPFQREEMDFRTPLDSGQVVVYSTLSGYEGGTKLYFKIAAFAIIDTLTGETSPPGPYSELDSATTEAGWPPSPTDFAAIAEGASIRLTWTDNSEPGHPLDEAAWGIMRTEVGSNYIRDYFFTSEYNYVRGYRSNTKHHL